MQILRNKEEDLYLAFLDFLMEIHVVIKGLVLKPFPINYSWLFAKST